MLYVWMPDGGAPGDRVGVKTKDYCINHDGANDASAGGGAAAVGAGSPFHVSNLTMFGCTFKVTNCSGCSISTVNTVFPTYQKTIPNMGVNSGYVLWGLQRALECQYWNVRSLLLQLYFWVCPFSTGKQQTTKLLKPQNRPVPAGTLLEGNGNTVTNFQMRYSNNGGLKIVGSNNTISESLFEDLTWLGS